MGFRNFPSKSKLPSLSNKHFSVILGISESFRVTIYVIIRTSTEKKREIKEDVRNNGDNIEFFSFIAFFKREKNFGGFAEG